MIKEITFRESIESTKETFYVQSYKMEKLPEHFDLDGKLVCTKVHGIGIVMGETTNINWEGNTIEFDFVPGTSVKIIIKKREHIATPLGKVRFEGHLKRDGFINLRLPTRRELLAYLKASVV